MHNFHKLKSMQIDRLDGSFAVIGLKRLPRGYAKVTWSAYGKDGYYRACDSCDLEMTLDQLEANIDTLEAIAKAGLLAAVVHVLTNGDIQRVSA